MKQRILVSEMGVADLWALPCVGGLLRGHDNELQVYVLGAGFAEVDDWIVQDDDGNWRIETRLQKSMADFWKEMDSEIESLNIAIDNTLK